MTLLYDQIMIMSKYSTRVHQCVFCVVRNIHYVGNVTLYEYPNDFLAILTDEFHKWKLLIEPPFLRTPFYLPNRHWGHVAGPLV